MTRPRAAILFLRTLSVCLWIVAVLGVLAVGAEFWLRVQPDGDSDSTQRIADSPLARLKQAYSPFDIQHLHPQYQFFFPFEPVVRVALSNDVVHLTAEGFRGPGPTSAGRRRLAFLLGGSAAFGDYASSDATTISGYLNQLQGEFFFVNAGVPSWISTQEMFRVAFELLKYGPALIVTYNGANDVDVLINHKEEGGGLLTVGAAESFLRLSALVDDIRADSARTRYQWFPALRRGFAHRASLAPGSVPHHMETITEDVLEAAALQYLNNVDRMSDMTTATGARFVTVFQPISGLHRHVRRDFEPWTWENDALSRFHRAVVARHRSVLEFHDLSAVFDTYFDDVPVRADELDDETIFVDGVHLTDRGNRLVAQRLVELLFPSTSDAIVPSTQSSRKNQVLPTSP